MKRCPRCGETKPLMEFNRNRSRPDGRGNHCRICLALPAVRPLRECPTHKKCSRCKNSRPITEFSPAKRSRDGHGSWCRHCQAAYNAEYRKKDKGRNRDLRLSSVYGLPFGSFDRMLREQEYGCALCGAPDSGKQTLGVDHRHSDGQVRSLLCNRCNLGIAFMEDLEWVARAQHYLRWWCK